LNYPDGNFRYGHYGKNLEQFIKKACELEKEDERQALTLVLANLMKKHYLTWNRDSVEDETVLKQLEQLSNGKLKLQEGQSLIPTSELLKGTKTVSRKRPQNKKKKSHSGRR
ncbi:MAG: DUF4290 domain-containing protein, partial [Flavobacteriales bacterium]|nr:DUF4290 domain-containing protein [Flavobacteriales bacterium]